jgi:Amt family ammonium transporter
MRRAIWPVILALVAAMLLLGIGVSWATETDAKGSTLALAMAFLFPIGLALVAWSALPPDRSDSAAGLATLAIALALIGYLATGFGFHFGGAAFVSDIEQLQSLSRFFSLVRGEDSAGWGFVGLEGFFLSGDAATPTALHLFIAQLPLVTAAVLIVMLGSPRKMPLLAVVLTGLIVAAVTFPVAGHWISGGGWLASLGRTLAFGHGAVDFGGAGSVFVLSAATVLAATLVFGRRGSTPGESEPSFKAAMPPAQFPLLAGLGAVLAFVGWIGITLANPILAEASDVLNWSVIALNGLTGLAGGTLTAQLYSWFASGRFDPLMGPRGALAGLVAVSIGAPFYPTWAALAAGGIAGLLLPLAVYIVEKTLRLDDATAAIGGYLLPGLWGLLAVALLADGRWGQGWNQANGVAEQGVSGLIVAPGLQPDTGQLAAQIWGAVALFALGFLLPWGIYKLIAWTFRLRLPGKKRTHHRDLAVIGTLNPSGKNQSPSGSLDGVVNTDDG